jgi:dihydrofolate synthase/folylpolyglutamate synthase
VTYQEAVARVLALRGGEHTGMRPGLERVEELLGALGHPEQRYTLVQVGGTNGKGSVAAMLASILKAGGHRVGLFTSPHLCSFRERIRVNAEPIAPDAVVDGVDALGTLIARFDASMFEATTALALDHFAREAVDVAVLEVGLGGRLDATTVGRPAATVLTRIDLDHQRYLGSTLAAIAGEKAAIIRSGIALSAAQAPEVEEVILRRAEQVRVPLLTEGRDLSVKAHPQGLSGHRISCAGPGFTLDDLDLPLLGAHQPGNALLAVAAAHVLGAGEPAIRAGLARAHWPGRLEIVRHDPLLVLDGAHNPAGARALARALRELFGQAPLTLVLGLSDDKDAPGILSALAPLATRLVLTRADNPRAVDPRALVGALPAASPRPEIVDSAAEALQLAMAPGHTPIVCIAGSLYLLGDVLTALAGEPDKPCPIEKCADI